MTEKKSRTPSHSWMDTALNKTKRLLEVGSEAADVLVHLQGGPTPLGIAAVGMRVVDSVRRHRAREPEDFFSQGWKQFNLSPLEQAIYHSFLADPHAKIEEVLGLHDDCPAAIVTIDEFVFGFALTGRTKTRSSNVRRCWIPEGQDMQAAMMRAGRSLWDTLKSSRAVLKTANEMVTFVSESPQQILPSKLGDKLYERIQKFLAKGHHRSAFLIGEPGVGKSCILRYIASLHGGFCLRIHLADVSKINGTTLINIVEILRPDVLIIDDFDRYIAGMDRWSKENPNVGGMLDPLERINELVHIFMVSANYSDSITDAALRPGRFDELLQIDEVDPELYEKLLPDAPTKVLADLRRKKVPAAYVQELKKRVDTLGYEAAHKEMNELLKRSHRILNSNRKKRARKRSLEEKTERQKAMIFDRQAKKFEANADRLRERADRLRIRAEKERQKAEKKAAKKKTAKKKSSKKKTK